MFDPTMFQDEEKRRRMLGQEDAGMSGASPGVTRTAPGFARMPFPPPAPPPGLAQPPGGAMNISQPPQAQELGLNKMPQLGQPYPGMPQNDDLMRRIMLARALGGGGQNNTPNASPWGSAAQGFANGMGMGAGMGQNMQGMQIPEWLRGMFGNRGMQKPVPHFLDGTEGRGRPMNAQNGVLPGIY
jgi:hypothetical protein